MGIAPMLPLFFCLYGQSACYNPDYSYDADSLHDNGRGETERQYEGVHSEGVEPTCPNLHQCLSQNLGTNDSECGARLHRGIHDRPRACAVAVLATASQELVASGFPFAYQAA